MKQLIIFTFFVVNQLFAFSNCDYYLQINKAEKFVVEQKLDSAKIIYDLVFVSYSDPFFKDVYVSVIIDVTLNKYNGLTREKVVFLFKKGYTFNRFKRNSVLKTIPENEKDVLKLAYKEYGDALVDVELRTKVNRLYQEDQKIRGGVYRFLFSGSLVKKDSLIHEEYVQLTKNNGGYIGEKVIGITGYSLASSASYILALHYDTDSTDQIGYYIDIALNEFQIHPLYYAGIKDRRLYQKQRKENFGTSIIWGREMLIDEKTNEINLSRTRICLDSLEDHQLKIRNRNGIHLIYMN